MALKGVEVRAGQAGKPERTCCYLESPEGEVGANVQKSSPVADILYPYQLEILMQPLFWRTR